MFPVKLTPLSTTVLRLDLLGTCFMWVRLAGELVGGRDTGRAVGFGLCSPGVSVAVTHSGRLSRAFEPRVCTCVGTQLCGS